MQLDGQQERYIAGALEVWLEADDVTGGERDTIEGILAKLEPTKRLMAQAHGRRQHVGASTRRCLACRKFLRAALDAARQPKGKDTR